MTSCRKDAKAQRKPLDIELILPLRLRVFATKII
jgi:plasmid replication initiation protein